MPNGNRHKIGPLSQFGGCCDVARGVACDNCDVVTTVVLLTHTGKALLEFLSNCNDMEKMTILNEVVGTGFVI